MTPAFSNLHITFVFCFILSYLLIGRIHELDFYVVFRGLFSDIFTFLRIGQIGLAQVRPAEILGEASHQPIARSNGLCQLLYSLPWNGRSTNFIS